MVNICLSTRRERRSEEAVSMMSVRAAAAIEPVGDVTAVLGEGPYWVPEDDCLLWVDIESAHLHRTYFPSEETVTDSLSAVSAAFPVVGGGILTVGGAALTLLFPAERGGQWSTRIIAEVAGPRRPAVQRRRGGPGGPGLGRVDAHRRVRTARRAVPARPRRQADHGGQERDGLQRARLVAGRLADVLRGLAAAPRRRVRLRPGDRRGVRSPPLRRPVRRRTASPTG